MDIRAFHLFENLDLGDQWWSRENIKKSRQENVSQNEITVDEIGQDLLSIFSYTKGREKGVYFSKINLSPFL